MSGKAKSLAIRKKLKAPSQKQANAAKDMYANPASNTGFGSTSQVNAGTYIPYRISLDYLKLLFMYRGSWIVRAVVDTIPEDMLKEFPALETQQKAEDIAEFDKMVANTMTLQKLIEALKWGRLFGGALAIIIIKGDNDLSKQLKIEDVDIGSYRGLIIVDRWSGVNPGAELISDLDNPAEYGLPKYYQVTTETNQNFTVHHSRVLRFTGRDLPLFEKQIQTYWGMSEVEAIFQELQRRDFIEAGIADLVSRAYVMVMKEPMLAQMLSGVGLSQQMYVDYVNRLRAVSESITTNGILALSEDGELQSQAFTFSGLSDIEQNTMRNVSAACGIPVSRLFGTLSGGLGDNGDSDLQTYYDTIDQKRKRELRPIFDKLIPIMCMSEWGEIPDDLDYHFPPIRTVNDKERFDLGQAQTEPIFSAFNAGIIGRQTALRELKQASDVTGLFTNITDEDIASADDDVSMPGESNIADPNKSTDDKDSES